MSAASAPTEVAARLVARTRRLDRDLDLLAAAGSGGLVWERGSVGLAGAGEALRIPTADPAAAQAVLTAIGAEDSVGLPGSGPVAFAALPFDPRAGGELIVPEVVWGRREGTRWITRIRPADAWDDADDAGDDLLGLGAPAPGLDRPAGATPHPSPASSFSVRSSRSPASWMAAVAAGRDQVRAGILRKLVLGREVVVEADAAFDVGGLLRRLRAAYPDAYCYCVDGFVGASPELLVSRTGDLVSAHPMAGTVPRSGDPTTDARLAAGLLASTKDRVEHQITIDAVHEALLPWCSYLDYEAEPTVVSMANVAHLATRVEGRLSDPTPSVLELVAALHPTPAVGGEPRDLALKLIDELEELDRGRFAGPVGWVDGRGNGSFAVGIRCAEVDRRTARLFAGVGVVADSDPEAELAETRAKLQALLTALVQP